MGCIGIELLYIKLIFYQPSDLLVSYPEMWTTPVVNQTNKWSLIESFHFPDVIHTVGPIVHGPGANVVHREYLQSCYATSLRRVLDHNKRNRAKLEAKKRRQEASKGDANVRGSGDGASKDEKEEASANGKQIAEEEGGSDILKSLRYDFEAPEPLIRSIAFPCISTGVYGM